MAEKYKRNESSRKSLLKTMRKLFRENAILKSRLARIAEILEDVDRRCMAADGLVLETREEITNKEMRAIYLLTKEPRP